MQTWDMWYSKAAATGLSFARCRIEPTDLLLVHAAPPVLSVTVVDEQGFVVAEGKDLPATQDTPIARLTHHDGQITRADIWPDEKYIGCVVALPGGEAGILMGWWNAQDQSEWRWQVEFTNRRNYVNRRKLI